MSLTAGDNYYVGLIPGQQTLSFSQYVVDKTLEQKTIEENALYQNGDGNGFAVEMLCPADMPRNVGALPGKFIISETQAVYFSKGNLVCNSDHTGWTFEANQGENLKIQFAIANFSFSNF